jgi:hypothetical protein
MSPTKLTATITSPPVAKARAPNRSEYHPEIGPATRNDTVSGSR